MIKLFHYCLSAIGFNPVKIARTIASLPRYARQQILFKRLSDRSSWPVSIYPILLDRNKSAASLGEYFWQDMLVAKEIISENPSRHIDVGSRVDGFIAHLACVRKVTVFDIRPLPISVENVEFAQWDITDPNPIFRGLADCVSCLHTLEHIGLGRYGDKLDPEGWRKGLQSLARLVTIGGDLWLSVPIGVQRVEFNADRVFNPETIINAAASHELTLDQFYYLTASGFIKSNNVKKDVKLLAAKKYGLGIFKFKKANNENP